MIPTKLFKKYILLLLLGNTIITGVFSQKVKFILVPEQDINLNSLVGRKSNKVDKLLAFRISNQITFRQYKKYLSDIKKDSSNLFYQSQLPKIERQDILNEKYRSSNEFDDDPVIGISQENACNYARWYGENNGEKSKIYRLPAVHEWISFYHVEKDILERSLFFDWTINAYDVSMFAFGKPDDFPYYFFNNYKKNSPPSMKLKSVIGYSYKFKADNPTKISETFGYYANEGYPDVGFRIIETDANDPFYKYVYPFQDDFKLK
jgi:hypothetical protein